MSGDSSSQQPGSHFPARGPAVPWGPVAAVILTVLAFFASQALAVVLLVAIFGTGDKAEEWLMSTTGQFTYVVLSDGFMLAAVWVFLWLKKATFKVLGLGRRPEWRDLAFGILGYIVYYVALIAGVIMVSMLTQVNLDQKQELGFESLGGTPDRLMALVSLVILAPVIEEIIYRGFVFTGMRKKLNFVWATLLTSLLFAAPHLLQSSEGLLWIAGIDTFILSVVLCFLREKTGALWASMLVHAIKNSLAFIILLSTAAL